MMDDLEITDNPEEPQPQPRLWRVRWVLLALWSWLGVTVALAIVGLSAGLLNLILLIGFLIYFRRRHNRLYGKPDDKPDDL